MSYEGYEQCICENGHYFTQPGQYAFSEGLSKCQCGSEVAWSNSVDETNCDSYGIVLMSDLNKLIISAEKTEVCNLGHTHITHKAIYRLPKEKELPRFYKDFDSSKMIQIIPSLK